ncbi:phosphatase domain-containing protein [Citreicoccus inhibens]|uniref:phosphatase domain-containing protein n=1 Tax=Citreicoccus inhibens TaxID=2849499 RepID=UPI002AA57BF1|nr:App1 family protein [Citreicoccus inhibens]
MAPALASPEGLTLAGRVLQDAPRPGSSPLSRNLRRLLAPNWEGASVEVEFQGVKASVTSGDDGAFSVDLRPGEGHRFESGPSVAEVRVAGARARARVEVVADDVPFLVVSDFDDTVAVTGVTSARSLLTSALLRDGHTQEAVPGMAAFYGCLRAGAAPAFALVSGSPIQYLSRVRMFLARNGFPSGFGVYLRDLGPGTWSGYKQPIIRRLLRQFPQPVVLVGDSGEKDPEVYREIRDEFPGRVKAIYIRDAGHSEDPKRFADMVLFQAPRTAAEHAAKAGLASPGCVAASLPVAKEAP